MRSAQGLFGRAAGVVAQEPDPPGVVLVSRTSGVAGTGVAAQELTHFIERVERMEEEKKAISDDIREVYAEMKGCGFAVRAVRELVRRPFSNSTWPP